MFLCKSSRPMIDDSFSVSLSSSKRRLNLRQKLSILKMQSLCLFKTLFDFKLARNNTNTFCKKKNRRRRRVCYVRARRERSFGATCNREERAFCDSSFFFCDVGAFYPFFFRRKTSLERDLRFLKKRCNDERKNVDDTMTMRSKYTFCLRLKARC